MHYCIDFDFDFDFVVPSFQSEAVVNSGPALYISPSGPNPLMVQVRF